MLTPFAVQGWPQMIAHEVPFLFRRVDARLPPLNSSGLVLYRQPPYVDFFLSVLFDVSTVVARPGIAVLGLSLPPPVIWPLVFIHAGGLQGEASSFTSSSPAASCAARISGIRYSRSWSMLKCFSSTSPSTSV